MRLNIDAREVLRKGAAMFLGWVDGRWSVGSQRPFDARPARREPWSTLAIYTNVADAKFGEIGGFRSGEGQTPTSLNNTRRAPEIGRHLGDLRRG